MKRLAPFVISLMLAVFWACGSWAGGQAPDCGDEPALSKSQHKVLYEAQQLFQKKLNARAHKELEDYYKDGGQDHHRMAFMRGMLAYYAKRLKEAEAAFAAAVKLWPCFGPGWRNLAAVQFEQNKPLAAAESARRAYRVVKPPDPELLYQSAVFYLNAGRPASAVRLLERLARNPKAKVAWLKALVNAYLKTKQPDKAEKIANRLIKMTPSDSWLWRLQADLALRKKRYAQAAAALDLAVRLGGPQTGDWHNLGELYLAAGAPLKAAELHSRHFGAEPKPENWKRLAEIYLQAGKINPGLAAARKAAAMEPSATNLAFLGEVCLRARRYRDASLAYEKAAKEAKGEESGRYLLRAGQSAFQADLLERAGLLFAQAMKNIKRNKQLKKDVAKQLEGVKQITAYFAGRGVF